MTSDWLAARIEEPRLRVVDCRFVLGRPGAGRQLYLDGHIAGAAYLDMDDDLSAPAGDPDPAHRSGPVGGRHPLPALEDFAAAARRAGISRGTTVVAYDQGMSGGAARLWWLLRHIGFDDVTVLEGGIAGWDGPLATGAEEIAPGDLTVGQVRDDVLDAGALLERDPVATLVLDVRAPERFRGETEPIDPVAGHIPGAVNVPPGEAFPAPPELVDADATLVASCGSGINACVLLLALAAAGREDGKLYPGSWSDWVARGLPVETGEGTSAFRRLSGRRSG